MMKTSSDIVEEVIIIIIIYSAFNNRYKIQTYMYMNNKQFQKTLKLKTKPPYPSWPGPTKV